MTPADEGIAAARADASAAKAAKQKAPRDCPFDGKVAGVEHDPDRVHGWRVVCSGCGASSAYCRAASYAIALWNRRTHA